MINNTSKQHKITTRRIGKLAALAVMLFCLAGIRNLSVFTSTTHGHEQVLVAGHAEWDHIAGYVTGNDVTENDWGEIFEKSATCCSLNRSVPSSEVLIKTTARSETGQCCFHCVWPDHNGRGWPRCQK